MRKLFQAYHVTIEAGLAAFAMFLRGQGLGEEQRVSLGRLGGSHQNLPRRLDLDRKESHVVAGQAVLTHDPQETLVRADAQRADLEIYLPRFARAQLATLLATFLLFAFVVQQV